MKECGATFTRKSSLYWDLDVCDLAAVILDYVLVWFFFYFFAVPILNKLISYPSSLPVSALIACSAGMLKVTQGSADLFAFMRCSVCWERVSFDVQGCQLGSRKHLTCRCQLGPKPSLRTHTYTHTHRIPHKHSWPSPRPPAACCIMKTVKVEEGKSVLCCYRCCCYLKPCSGAQHLI